MTKKVAIDDVISTNVLMRERFIIYRDNRAFGDMIPLINALIDALDKIIDFMVEIEEAK